MARYSINCKNYPLPEINITLQDYNIYSDIDLKNVIQRLNSKYTSNRWSENVWHRKEPPNIHVKHTNANMNETTFAKLQAVIRNIINKKIDRIIQNTPCLSLVNRCKLNTAKTRIENYSYYWDKIKMLTNPYERIYMTSNKQINNFTYIPRATNTTYEPLSRSYFKMVEIANSYLQNYLTTPTALTTLHLAEGPGGFIEALIWLRKNKRGRHPFFNLKDSMYAMTLLDNADDVPAWKRSVEFLRMHPEINILSGVDGTGNLYNIDNIKYMQNRLMYKKANLVTADGGFDFSVGYNSQEFLACKLIFAEIVACMACIAVGGSFVCKFFDLNSKLTVDMLYLLQCHFTMIDITKPITSRSANSEKYIICYGFKGITDTTLNSLFTVLETWNRIDADNTVIINEIVSKCTTTNPASTECKPLQFVSGLFSYECAPPVSFYGFINKINDTLINTQISNIDETLDIIINKKYNDKDWFNNKIKQQDFLAQKWLHNNSVI